MNEKEKRLKKRLKREKSRSFHTAIELLNHADRELTILRALALYYHDITFSVMSRNGSLFTAMATRDRCDARSIELFAELVSPSIRFGLCLRYFDALGEIMGEVTFARQLPEPQWFLTACPAVLEIRRDDGMRRSLRRIGASFEDARPCGGDEAIFRIANKIMKDYHETVLVPRRARKAAT